MCTAVIVGGVAGLLIRGVVSGRRKQRNEEFDNLDVGKDNGVMEGEMDGNVTYT